MTEMSGIVWRLRVLPVIVLVLTTLIVPAQGAFASGSQAPSRTLPWPSLGDPDTNINGMAVLNGDLFVINNYSGGGRIHRLSTASGALLSSLPASVGYQPASDIASDGTWLYVIEAAPVEGRIHRLDPVTGSDLGVITPTGITITGGAGGLAYTRGQLHIVVATVECAGVSIVHLNITGEATGCVNVDTLGINRRELDQAGQNLLYGATSGRNGPYLLHTLDANDTVIDVTELTTTRPDSMWGLACGTGELFASDRAAQVINAYTFASCATSAPKADIDVDLTGAPRLGILVPSLQFTLTARNLGPDQATAATLTATIPPGVVATSLSSGCTQSGNTIACTYGAMANGTSLDKTFRLPLSVLGLGTVNVTATRTTSAPEDPHVANDSATASCTVVSILLVTCQQSETAATQM
ncbi:hypothetical protein GCM10028775_47630 [Catellatospora paridis]